jgi:hypothetical protein
MSEDMVMGIAYYKEKDWSKFLELFDDRDEMEKTWFSWYKEYKKVKKFYSKKLFHVEDVIIDLDELKQYCIDNNLPNITKVRSEFVSKKVAQRHNE